MVSKKRLSSPQAAGCAANKAGLTLIELLVSCFIFLTFTLASTTALRRCGQLIAQASVKNQAFYLAQAKMEQTRAMPFNQLLTLKDPRVTVTTLQPGLVSLTVKLNPAGAIDFETWKSQYE